MKVEVRAVEDRTETSVISKRVTRTFKRTASRDDGKFKNYMPNKKRVRDLLLKKSLPTTWA